MTRPRIRTLFCIAASLASLSAPRDSYAFSTLKDLRGEDHRCAEEARTNGSKYFSCLEEDWNQSLARSIGMADIEDLKRLAYEHKQPGDSQGKIINGRSTFNWSLNECALRWGAWPLPRESINCLFERFSLVAKALRPEYPKLIKRLARDEAERMAENQKRVVEREKRRAEKQRTLDQMTRNLQAEFAESPPIVAGFPMCNDILMKTAGLLDERLAEMKRNTVDLEDSELSQVEPGHDWFSYYTPGAVVSRKTAEDYVVERRVVVDHYYAVPAPAPAPIDPYESPPPDPWLGTRAFCVMENTEVLALSPDQSASRSVPIESIEVGDYILSNPLEVYDVEPEDIRPCWSRVIKKRPRELADGEEVLNLTFRARGNANTETISSTPSHPFYVSRDGGKQAHIAMAGELKRYESGQLAEMRRAYAPSDAKWVGLIDDQKKRGFATQAIRYFVDFQIRNSRPGLDDRELMSSSTSDGQPLCFFSDSTGFVCPIQGVTKNNVEDRWFFQHWTWAGGSRNPSVYDLTIEGTHTFYVKDPKGKTFILVHNKY